MQNSVIEIDLGAIDHNMALLSRVIGADRGICPILKGDGYGLGAARLGPRLQRAGAAMLAVYSPEQAAELFAVAIGVPVLVLMPVRNIERADELYRGLICGRLHLTVHDREHLENLVALADRYGCRISVHLEVDSGLCRGGCPVEEAPPILERIAASPRLHLAGLFTHFAAAHRDVALTTRQIEAFEALVARHRAMIPEDIVLHAANTCATFRSARYHQTMVRVGLAWAGYGQELLSGRPRLADVKQLRPSVTWRSRIIQTRRVPAGKGVGYNHLWTTPRDSTLAIVPVGYGDGYRSALSGGGDSSKAAMVRVLVETGGATERLNAPVVGSVNMDQIMIDLTTVIDARADLAERRWIDCPVEVISADPQAPNHLPKLAAAAGVLPHDFLCGLSPRLRRVYRDPAPVIVETRPATAAARVTVVET